MAERVTSEELALAASWLREYNDGQTEDERGHDETAVTMFKVAAWIESEVARRAEEAQVRKVAKQYKVSHSRARIAINKIREKGTT